MTKAEMPNLPTQPGSLGEPGSAAPGRLRWGRRAGFSVKLHRGIVFVIIASVFLWGALIAMLRLVWAQ
jgi:hypothetical protein